MENHLKTIAAISVISLVGLALVYSRGGEDREIKPGYVTAKIRKETLTAKIICSGNLRPLVEVKVGSQVSGIIKELYADYESRVQKGELIALIDPATFEAKVARARADLKAAEAMLRKSRVTLKERKRNLERQKKLLARGSISQSEYEAAETEALQAEAQAGVDLARKIQAKAGLKEAMLDLSRTRIRAPVEGVVISRNVDVGQTVAASFQAPVLFTIGGDLKRMQVYTNVDEADIGRVRVNQEALFTVPAYEDKVFHATVSQIRNEPQIEQNVVTYNVVLDLSNERGLLRPGMTANAQIVVGKVQDALIAPARALRFSPGPEMINELPELSGGERRIWRLNNGSLEPVITRIGLKTPERVQILSDSLKEGDQVILDLKRTKKPKTGFRGLRLRF